MLRALKLAASHLKKEIEKHTVIFDRLENKSNTKITSFLKVTRYFVFRIRKELEDFSADVSYK